MAHGELATNAALVERAVAIQQSINVSVLEPEAVRCDASLVVTTSEPDTFFIAVLPSVTDLSGS